MMGATFPAIFITQTGHRLIGSGHTRPLEQIVPDWNREAIHRRVNLLANKGLEHFQSG